MAKEKKVRDKTAEKTVKTRISTTHLKSYQILGSEKKNDISTVYILRKVNADNYLFKVNCALNLDGTYALSGLIPVNKEDGFGEYRVYNPKEATIDVLRPVGSEKKFKGYNK